MGMQKFSSVMSLENQSSAEDREFVSAKSNDEICKDHVDVEELSEINSSVEKHFGNGLSNDILESESEKLDRLSSGSKSVSEETRKSSTDLPVVHNCDKFSNHEHRVNGDIPIFHDDGSVSSTVFNTDSGDSDSGSGKSSSCPQKRLMTDDFEDSLSCSQKRLKIDDSVVPNDCSDSEDRINSSSSSNCQKNTARKSTGGNVPKTIAHLMENGCTVELSAEEEDLVIPMENGVDHSTTDNLEVKAPSEEKQQSPVDDKKYPIKFTRESISKESLQNVSRKILKRLSRRQLEEIVLQKCCEIISESGEIGEMKKILSESEETEIFRKNKELSIEKQIYQLKAASEVFCNQARLAKENGQIITPKVITRSVGLQVSLRTAKFDSSSTRANSVDEADQRTPSSVINVHAGRSSTCTSLKKSRTSSFSETVNTKISPRSSLPINNKSAGCSKSSTVLPAEKMLPSETPAKVPPASSNDVIVDLTDVDDITDSPPKSSSITARNGLSISRLRQPSELLVPARHPAPLPPMPRSRNVPGAKLPPPKPSLSIQKINLAIQMTWDLPLSADYEPIEKYQIYAYQETPGIPATVSLWNFVGDVESLDLPMACTLTQFVKDHTYHFTVRAVDKHGRHGAFSCARSVAL